MPHPALLKNVTYVEPDPFRESGNVEFCCERDWYGLPCDCTVDHTAPAPCCPVHHRWPHAPVECGDDCPACGTFVHSSEPCDCPPAEAPF